MVPPVWLAGRATALGVRDGPEAWPWAELETVAKRLTDDHRAGDLMEACRGVNRLQERVRNAHGEMPESNTISVLHVLSSYIFLRTTANAGPRTSSRTAGFPATRTTAQPAFLRPATFAAVSRKARSGGFWLMSPTGLGGDTHLL